ncbi:hypothetical protein RUND412_001074 [Rhizina undulata]
MTALEVCVACTNPLVIPAEEEEEEAGSSMGIVDDIELICGHHYHWSCFADEYSAEDATPETKRKCPNCGKIIVDPVTEKLLVTLRNEGGLQRDVDLGALLDEEEFYDRNPEFKRTRAFLEFCAEGDVETVTDMIEEEPDLVNVQDFETGQTGLHVAVQNQRENIVDLLVQKGAGRNARDSQGKNFIELAEEMGATDDQLRRLMAL